MEKYVSKSQGELVAENMQAISKKHPDISSHID